MAPRSTHTKHTVLAGMAPRPTHTKHPVLVGMAAGLTHTKHPVLAGMAPGPTTPNHPVFILVAPPICASVYYISASNTLFRVFFRLPLCLWRCGFFRFVDSQTADNSIQFRERNVLRLQSPVKFAPFSPSHPTSTASEYSFTLLPEVLNEWTK